MSDAAALRAELASIQARQNEVTTKLRDMQAPRQAYRPNAGSSYDASGGRSYTGEDARQGSCHVVVPSQSSPRVPRVSRAHRP